MIKFKSSPDPGRRFGGFVSVGGRETNPIARCIADVSDGLSMWRLWTKLAWFDLIRKYRRSHLGPFWITLSTAIFIAGLGLVFTYVFTASANKYIPHLAAGVIFWQLIGGTIKTGTTAFTSAHGLIMQKPLPYSLHVFRQLTQSFLTLLHTIIILVPVWFIYDEFPGVTAFWALPGLVVIFVNGVWVMLVLGIVCARYRDLAELIPSILQLMFFLTPIMWQPNRLGRFSDYLYFNPFYNFLEIVRAPMLGNAPDPKAWICVGIITVIGWLIALQVFGSYRRRIPFWI